MSNVIDNYRHNHSSRPRSTWHGWLRFGWRLAAIVALALIGWQAVGFLSSPHQTLAAQWQDPAALLGPMAGETRQLGPPETTGSVRALGQFTPATAADDGWFFPLYVLGIGGLTGLIVFVALSRRWPSQPRDNAEVAGAAGTQSRSLADRAADRRWHGGPIRN